MLTNLKVQLSADGVLVAESAAPALWISVLRAILEEPEFPCPPGEDPPQCVGSGSEPLTEPRVV